MQIDNEVPYWRSNEDVEFLLNRFSYSPERAQAWLKFLHVPDCRAYEQAVTMKGTFSLGYLGHHTYNWIFTPGQGQAHAVVLPVSSGGYLVDLLAVSRESHHVWGCVTGAGQYAGHVDSPIHLYASPIDWLQAGKGVLPLAKSFFPLLQGAPEIVVVSYDHAWDIAERSFIAPAIQFGGDPQAAEDEAMSRISVEVTT